MDKAWKEWIEEDKKLSSMTKEERNKICKDNQWVFKKETIRFVDLECLYSSNRTRHNREEFKKWFYVITKSFLSRIHLGDNSYSYYKSQFKEIFGRETNSDYFSQRVILVLAILGYIKAIDIGYSFQEGRGQNHGYHYLVDKEKLGWLPPSISQSTPSSAADTTWETTTTTTFIEEGEDQDLLTWKTHDTWLAWRQYNSICSIDITADGKAEAMKWLFDYRDTPYYYSLSDEEKIEVNKKSSSYEKLLDIQNDIIGRCSDDSEKTDGTAYAGRFHTIMTSMKKEHRHNYVLLDGERVVEVDVSSAQPTFLGILMFRETGKKSEWLKQCLAGDFYDWIKEKTNSSEDRGTIKGYMMKYLYSCYQAKKGKEHKNHHATYENKKTKDPFLLFQQRLNKFLKKEEPDFYNKIQAYKKNPTFRDHKAVKKIWMDENGRLHQHKTGQGKWTSMLSYHLCKLEVEYIKACIKALPEDIKFWTIYDCICVPESRSKEVQSIMEEVSRRLYGEDIQLSLKRENTTPPA